MTPSAADATGIPAGLRVFATADDKAVEALGCGLDAEDTVLLSLGTYITAMTTGTSPQAASDGCWVNFGATPGEYLHESRGIRRGMWTGSWFRDRASGLGRPGSGQEAQALEDTLNAESALVPPGCGGLMTLLDWLPPADAPQRRGAMVGFDGSQGRAHVYRSIPEGIALTMAGHVARMERDLGRRFDRLLVAGGGSRSPVLMAILADVFDRPTCRAACRTPRAWAPRSAPASAPACTRTGRRPQRRW